MHQYNYLKYDMPEEWCEEEDSDTLSLYDPEGMGAITISFYSIVNKSLDLVKTAYDIAEDFINKNDISMSQMLTTDTKNETKIVVVGTGTDSEYYYKIWCIAQHPKIVLATYICEELTAEEKICDEIIDSIRFNFDG